MAQLTEYLSKLLLAREGIAFPASRLVHSATEAANAQAELGTQVMVKAQVPAGGRGKAGAIRSAQTPAEAAAAFEAVTAATFGRLQPESALVEVRSQAEAEVYLAVTVDASSAGPALLFNPTGGVEVEATAGLELIPLREDGSLPAAPLRRAAYASGLKPAVAERLVALASAIACAHARYDAYLVELNPVAIAVGDVLVPLDAKLVFDDHAGFRQPELLSLLAGMRPRHAEDLIREQTRLEYVRLDGNLGLISGGAGMTMAVMDLIADAGGRPACFLDCSNNPTPEGYGAALDLLLSDDRVRAILISIFGGLTQMDRVAKTLVALFSERQPSKPITLRLMGTNIEAAEAVLAAAGLVNHRQLEVAVRTAIAVA